MSNSGSNHWWKCHVKDGVRSLSEQFGFKLLVEIFHILKNKFEASLLTHRNTVVCHLAQSIIPLSLNRKKNTSVVVVVVVVVVVFVVVVVVVVAVVSSPT